ncbi:MAG TPA: glutamate--tRNA ligase [Alphaproteobacteria bacterium]|nr:glutamate--tRNA ligase [Alphaproteobacteria bacterium]
MIISELQLTIRKHALANAVKFNGKASAGSVISKIIAEIPDAKANMKVVSQEVNNILKHINELSLDVQMKELEEKFPEMLEKKVQEERNIFAVLGIKSDEKVVSGFPPGPEKYPHIGHAKACLMNYMLAKQYNGKFLLRFEDTNPDLVRSEFYDIMQENFKWLGVEWDELMYASDYMEKFYELALKALADGNAYVCFCSQEDVSRSREFGEPCGCRSRTNEENVKLFEEIKSYEGGKAIVRLKIDLKHQNTTLRDPTIFRLIDTPHARLGTQYRLWPNYDWQNAIMDSITGITIRVRSKEFELRNELQRHIQAILGLRVTRTYEFARFNLEGVESSGRKIREKVQSGELTGWDDPRLTTIVALRRRGFLPEAIKNFVLNTGMSKSESTLTWDDLILQNRRLLDKTAKRFFMMYDYEKIFIENAPTQTIQLKYHPDSDEKGSRNINTEKDFLILKSDLESLKEGGFYRFMDCLNFRKQGNMFIFDSLEHEKFRNGGSKIMHWLPAYGNVEIEILTTEAQTINGVAEHNIKNVKVGEVIQFERFGFCRLDSIEKNHGKEVYKFWFTHK